MTPFSLDGGRTGDGGVDSRFVVSQGDASQTHTRPAAPTPSPGLSPIEGERSPCAIGPAA